MLQEADPAGGQLPAGRAVLVVDDHPVVRRGMAALLTAESWVGEVHEAGTVEEARRSLTVHAPGLAVLDLTLPDGDGVGLLRELPTIAPGCVALIVTMTNDPGTVRAALDAGARGYVLKDSAPDMIVAAVRAVAGGGRVLGPRVDDGLAARRGADRPPPPFDLLTPRELRLALLLAGGRTNREIADDLLVSEKTVRNQVATVIGKLGVADRVQAVLLAHRVGLTG
ncbi:MAG TPA: response regulator transcription factor [Pilimelia sp.]|nr:response regulator transcription factor [Pilimelia sp.]